MSNAAPVVVALVGLALALSKRAGAAPGGVLDAAGVRSFAERITGRYFPAVDPRMLVRMAWIESSFRPDAVRHEWHLNDASVGLMQTLTRTAQWLWDDMGARAYPRPDMAALLDPETSLYFGAAYVNWLRRYGGRARSEQWIVESYNGGPGNSNSQTRNHWAKYLAAKERFG